MIRSLVIAAAAWTGVAIVLVAAALAALIAAAQGEVVTAALIAGIGIAAFSGLQLAAVHATDTALAALQERRTHRRTARTDADDPVDAVAIAAGVLTSMPERPGRHTVDGPTSVIPAVIDGTAIAAARADLRLAR